MAVEPQPGYTELSRTKKVGDIPTGSSTISILEGGGAREGIIPLN